MKQFGKKAAVLLVCAALLVGGVLAAGLGEEDSLISLSYLEQLFIPAIVDQGADQAKDHLEQTYQSVQDVLDTLADGYLHRVGAGETGGYSTAYGRRTYAVGDVLTLETGSGVLLEAGRVVLTHTGTVVDVTSGQSVSSGTVLSPNCRYLAAEDTRATLTVESDAARMALEGVFSLQASGEKATPFTDITIHDWYRDAVNVVYERGLFVGTDETLFDPQVKLNRAMMMTVLFHLAGDPEQELDQATASFLDVKAGEWFEPFVRWAGEQGISAGFGDGTFRPLQTLTYREVVQFLYNFASSYLGMELSQRADLSGYEGVDILRRDGWGEDAMSWAVGAGIITQLRPNEHPARGDVAAIMAAFIEKYFPEDAPA